MPGGVTTEVGLFDAEHTSPSGYPVSQLDGINSSGQMIGRSYRYDATFKRGESAWLYNGTTVTNIGLVDSLHTTRFNERWNTLTSINDAGQVLGMTNRYPKSALGGTLYTTWLYSAANGTQILRLQDIAHTRSDGQISHRPIALTESGRVLGEAWRFDGGDVQLGTSSFVYDGMTVRRAGLTDAEHTSDGTSQHSECIAINEAGQAIGWSNRHMGGSTYLGRSAWFFDGLNTQKIGLTGSGYTRDTDGRKLSEPEHISAGGIVLGWSQRYVPGGATDGRTAWIFDGVTTVSVGPGTVSYIYPVDGSDFAVGSYGVLDGGGILTGYQGVIYHPDWGVVDFGDLLNAAGATEWSQPIQLAVTADGDLVGMAYSKTAKTETAFRMTLSHAPINIDIQIWDADNEIDLAAGGAATVALLSQSLADGSPIRFDATQIDPASLRFGVGGAPTTVNPLWTIDHNGDGQTDAGASFDIDAAAIACEDTELTVTGALLTGETFSATDVINPINCDTGSCHP